LVVNFNEAMQETRAKLIFVVNIMTKKSETHGYPASRFAGTLLSYLGRKSFDAVIVNNQAILPEIQKCYRAERAYPVIVDTNQLKKFTRRIIRADLADQTGGVIRHSDKIASIIARI
jgi:uncharacterized cofD-like protein